MTERTVGPKLAGALVFLTSGAVLVLEILSLRLVAPYVGLTLETNTAVIGVALAAIATGAWLGGRTADTIAPERLLGPLTLGGGALVLVVLPLVRWTGRFVQGGDPTAVLLIAVVAVFAPAALLAAVTPVVVKLRLAELKETGTIVGRLSGIGTLGAIAATFGTGFVLVAMVPTSVILLVLGGLLVLAGIALTVWLRGWRAVRAPLVLALIGTGATTVAPNPCQLETAYHCARVTADPDRAYGRVLRLDNLRHSYVDLKDPRYLEFAYTKGIASAVDVFYPDGPIDALHIGGGGLTMPRYLAATHPGSRSRVLEIDRGVLGLDDRELDAGTIPGLTTEVTDARIGVARRPSRSVDLVVGDAFGGVAVPWHLTTAEFVAEIRRVLRDGGLYAANIIDHPPLNFLRAELRTIRRSFPNVVLVAPPESLRGERGGNFVVLASSVPIPADRLATRLGARAGELSVLAGSEAVAGFVGDDATLLTDDFAPVDQLLTPYEQAGR